ncbi:hypothetical protein BKA81DRAFT_360971 [Phyllosticta paracitricarpa]
MPLFRIIPSAQRLAPPQVPCRLPLSSFQCRCDQSLHTSCLHLTSACFSEIFMSSRLTTKLTLFASAF